MIPIFVAFIVFECLETPVKHVEAHVFEIASQTAPN